YPKIRNIFSQLAMAFSGGHLYLAGEENISVMQGDSVKQLYNYSPNETARIHFDMKEIAPGILGIATCNALLRYDTRTNKVDTLFTPGNYCVRNIWQYKDYTFFGTYGNGLYILRMERPGRFPLIKIVTCFLRIVS